MGQTAYLELAYPVKCLTAQTVKLHIGPLASHSSCDVRLISRDARLSGYFFHRLSLRDGGETGTFLSNQTFPRATPKACVCSLATLKKSEELTRTLLLRRRLVGRLWLANFRCHNYYLHLTASGQPVGTAQQWRGTTFNRSFSGLIGGSQMSQSAILMNEHFISYGLLFTFCQPSPLQVQNGQS